MTELHLKNLTELRQGLEARQFSSLELTKQILARIEQQRNLNAFITVAGDYALKQAQLADKRLANGERGALLGIPIAVKDMILTRGIRTTAASKILDNFIAPYSATVVEKLEADGAVIVGKTNMDEFAMGSSNENSPFGPVKNPWNHDLVPGGSSGGSAAAVAGRLVPLSLGTDTGGSIRQPASFCGICGMKPTYGRVSRYGVVAFASSLDQVGGFAADVRGLAAVIRSISGHCPHDSTSVERAVPDFAAALGGDIKGMRIGIPKEYFISGLNPQVEAAVRGALKKMVSMGAELVEISLPHTEAAVSTYYILAPAEASSNLARYDGVRYGYRAANSDQLYELYARSRSEGFGTEVRRRIMVGTYVLSAGYYDAYYLRAQKVRRLIADDFAKAFSARCDVIACPTAPTTAFKIGDKVDDPLAMYLNDIFTIPVNLAGLPGMSLPCGFDQQGLPIGMQLIGKAWDEESLFKLAYAYEQSEDWSKRTPGN